MKFPLIFGLLLLLGAYFHPLSAQRQGYPFTQTYSINDYQGSPSTWFIAENEEGTLFFANGMEGVQIYNGAFWHSIDINNSNTNVVVRDPDNRIFVGAFGTFGYIELNKKGQYTFTNLSHKLDPDIKLGSITSGHYVDNSIIFSTRDHIVRYDIQKDTATVFLPETRFLFTSDYKNHLYFTQFNVKGIFTLADQSFHLLPGSEALGNNVMRGAFAHTDSSFIFVLSESRMQIFNDTSFTPFPTDLDPIWKDINPLGAKRLYDGHIAVETQHKGIYILNQSGKIIEHYHDKNILPLNYINFIYEARDGQLWVSLSNHFVKIEYGSPYRIVEKKQGVKGNVNDMAVYNNDVYWIGLSGFFGMIDQRVEQFYDDLITSGTSLAVMDQSLLVGRTVNSYELRDDWVIPLTSHSVRTLKPFPNLKNHIALLSGNFMVITASKELKWHEQFKSRNYDSQLMSLHITSDSTLVMLESNGTFHELTLSLKPYDVQLIREVSYTSDVDYPGFISSWHYLDGELLVNTNKGIQSLTKGDDGKYTLTSHPLDQLLRIIPRVDGGIEINSEFAHSPRIMTSSYDSVKQAWIISESNLMVWVKKTNTGWEILPESEELYRKSTALSEYIMKSVRHQDTIWMGSREKLFLFNTAQPPVAKPENTARIARLIAGGTTKESYLGNFPGSFSSLTRELSFEFSSYPLIDATQLKYRYKLEGYDKVWSAWAPTTKKEYTNLKHGKYVFYVQSFDAYNRISAPLAYRFEITPPLYLSNTAKTLYVMLGAGALFFLLQLRAKMEAKKLRAEFEEEKRIIEETRMRQELADARTFQLSMLPEKTPDWPGYRLQFDMVTATEVGGDYYDYFVSSSGSNYVVVGDAAGHGTAAGMMVSITKTALNSIKAQSPADALIQLNAVIRTFNTRKMKMALSVIKLEEDGIVFSSAAMPPVFHYRKKDHSIAELLLPGLPLGAMIRSEYDEIRVEMNVGDLFIAQSDGLIETENEAGEQFGYERFRDLVLNHATLSSDELITKLKEEATIWRGGESIPADDITLVIIQKV